MEIEPSELGRLLGSIRTEKKSARSRENLEKVRWRGGRGPRPVDSFPCDCPAPDVKHLSTCPRGRALKRAAKRAERE